VMIQAKILDILTVLYSSTVHDFLNMSSSTSPCRFPFHVNFDLTLVLKLIQCLSPIFSSLSPLDIQSIHPFYHLYRLTLCLGGPPAHLVGTPSHLLTNLILGAKTSFSGSIFRLSKWHGEF
jgi:hypothetical protein